MRKTNQIYLICEGEGLSTQIPPSINREFTSLSKDTNQVSDKGKWIIQEDLAANMIERVFNGGDPEDQDSLVRDFEKDQEETLKVFESGKSQE